MVRREVLGAYATVRKSRGDMGEQEGGGGGGGSDGGERGEEEEEVG